MITHGAGDLIPHVAALQHSVFQGMGWRLEMDLKKIGGLLMTIAIAGVFMYMRMEKRQAANEAMEGMAKSLIPQVDGYEANRKWYDARTDVAIGQAITASSSFQKVGRRRRNVLDESAFLPNFIDKLIAMAQNEGKPDVVKSLIALRNREGIARSSDVASD